VQGPGTRRGRAAGAMAMKFAPRKDLAFLEGETGFQQAMVGLAAIARQPIARQP
jgi:hypothetical protein